LNQMKFDDLKNKIDAANSQSFSNNNLEIILDILKKINSSLVMQDVLDLVLKHAIIITDTERGFIVLKNSDKELSFELGLNAEGKNLPASDFRISTTIVNEVFRTGQSKFIESAKSNRELNTAQSITKLELETIFCSPLILNEEKIGAIYVDSKKLSKIDLSKITQTFEILAGQAAVAINNAMLHNQKLKALTELQQAYDSLNAAKKEVEKSDSLKAHFLSQISHEIRTPINVIFGAKEMLKLFNSENINDDTLDAFRMLDEAGNRLMRTVDEIIDISTFTSGNYKYEPVEINLDQEILKDLIAEFKNKISQKNLLFEYNNYVPEAVVTADSYMLTQTIKHLIENAIKYTSSGKIKLELYKDFEGLICLSVKDTGIGISQEYLEDLFNPFTQEEIGYTRKFEGNGLGLAIVKKYADRNNIGIAVKSKKGMGTEFTLVFK
jgi:signal transduction histidine kinase